MTWAWDKGEARGLCPTLLVEVWEDTEVPMGHLGECLEGL